MSFLQHGDVKVEAEEEVDLIDPVIELREHCGEKSQCKKYEERLQSCNERVKSKSKTTESCHEEMIDWLHELDHCCLITRLEIEKINCQL